MLICSLSLTGHALATAELIQHVALLSGQALLDAICDHTIWSTHAALFCMLLTQLDLGIMCVHLVQRLAMSVAIMHKSDDLEPCSACSKGANNCCRKHRMPEADL